MRLACTVAVKSRTLRSTSDFSSRGLGSCASSTSRCTSLCLRRQKRGALSKVGHCAEADPVRGACVCLLLGFCRKSCPASS